MLPRAAGLGTGADEIRLNQRPSSAAQAETSLLLHAYPTPGNPATGLAVPIIRCREIQSWVLLPLTCGRLWRL